MTASVDFSCFTSLLNQYEDMVLITSVGFSDFPLPTAPFGASDAEVRGSEFEHEYHSRPGLNVDGEF